MTEQSCKRCGRTDLEILSNGCCRRCDGALYNYHRHELFLRMVE